MMDTACFSPLEVLCSFTVCTILSSVLLTGGSFYFFCCSAFDRQVQIGVLQNHCTLTCPPTHLMPGYRIARSDQKRVGQKYMCNFCSLLLRDAMQTGCGHFYCSSCLGSLSLWVKLVLNDILLLVLLGNHLLTYKLWSCLLSMQC